MKTLVFSILFIICFSNLALAELTKDDLEEVRKIVKEEVNDAKDDLRREMNSMRSELKAEIGGLRWTVTAFFALVAILIGLPQILGFFRERSDFEKRLRQLEEKLSH